MLITITKFNFNISFFFLIFILQEIVVQSRKPMNVASSPHRPIDVTFSKQFFFSPFFFLEDFGLRQCCKSILLSPNVSRWMCVEAVKVNDRSLTHSWWFQVEEKKRKKLTRVNRHLMEHGDSRRGCSCIWRHAFCCSRISGGCQEAERGCLCLSCCFRMVRMCGV